MRSRRSTGKSACATFREAFFGVILGDGITARKSRVDCFARGDLLWDQQHDAWLRDARGGIAAERRGKGGRSRATIVGRCKKGGRESRYCRDRGARGDSVGGEAHRESRAESD